ncbi:uncharacterized protein LOC100574153 [Acyrthosiphon pisum]|uniref:THAP-type domain-containing protein n=1 Tax=Acyrthosiphon pisum TaxID=7029 RepID=A0A8R2NS43_ACYPI|nr:uncharacterized protein LOC100574153 [Acyrthosiphon pisum]
MSCCVPSCAHKGESTFGVPKDIDQLNLWNVRIGIDLKPSSRVCSNHFDHKDVIKTWESGQGTSKYTVCLKRARLCEGTIPENITLGLGLNNSFIYVATQEWNNTPLTKKRKVQDNLKLSSIQQDHCYSVHQGTINTSNMSTVLYTSDTSNDNSTISPTSEYSIIESKL